MSKRKNSKLKAIANKNKDVEQNFALNGLLMDAFCGVGTLTDRLGSEVDSAWALAVSTRGYLITNQGQLLSDIYATNGLISKFIDMPVEDAFSSGFKITSSELTEEEIKELEIKMLLEGDMATLKEAFIWKRLFGGGGIIVITNGNYSKKFSDEEIEKDSPLSFKAFSKWDLTRRNYEDLAYEDFDWDSFHKAEFDYYRKKLHRSRMFLLKGRIAPTNKMRQVGGWGLSEIERLLTHINQFIRMNQLIYEIISEYKIDIMHLDGLNQAIKNDFNILQRRAQEISMIKNNKGMLVLDKQDNFSSRNLTFSGIPEILSKNENHFSAMCRIPATRFWGISASGFSSGNEDIEAYNTTLRSEIQTPAHAIIIRMVQLRARQLTGKDINDIGIEFNPLRDLTVADKELSKNGEFTRITSMYEKGAITQEEYIDAINKNNLAPIKVRKDV